MKRPLTVLARVFILGAVLFTFAAVTGRATAAHPHYYIAGKHITISLRRQRLRAWVGNTVILSTPVTTGNPRLPTPVGYFSIFYKSSPYTFISPWAYGSPYWYPPSEVNWALEFAAGGYFIHDAPWRSAFGPGTNQGWPPGTDYGGTHGCVNVPYAAARFLYDWAPIGTPVHVVP